MAIRWGILGCGDVARKRVAAAIQSDSRCELVAVCRRNPEKLRRFCDDFRVPFGTTSDAELLARPDIDAVYIATPVDRHRPQTVAAAKSGKHVLVEKPMALSVAECDDMIAACQSSGVRLGVAFYRPFYPVIRRLRELIETGAIGKVLSVSAVTSTPFAIGETEDGYWRVIPERGGGGALMDIGSHRLDLFLHLFGRVAEVKALCSTIAAAYDADDAASLLLRFESGVHGTLNCFFGANTDPDEFAILGTSGRLVACPLNSGELSIERGSNRTIEQHPPHVNFNVPLIADFVTAITEQRAPFVSGEQGREVNRLMTLAYESGDVRQAATRRR